MNEIGLPVAWAYAICLLDARTPPAVGAQRTHGVSALRMHAARFPDDPELARLVGELSVQDSDFRAWWAGHLVTSTSSSVKHYHHAAVGDLTLDCDTWASPGDPDQRLVILSAEPGTSSYDALQILTSWATPSSPQAEFRDSRTVGLDPARGRS